MKQGSDGALIGWLAVLAHVWLGGDICRVKLGRGTGLRLYAFSRRRILGYTLIIYSVVTEDQRGPRYDECCTS